jgi:hypothetical protein
LVITSFCSFSTSTSLSAAHADAGRRFELSHFRQRKAALARRLDDGSGERMLAALIQARRQPQRDPRLSCA